MNTGVSTVPWGGFSRPLRAPVAASIFSNSKVTIAPMKLSAFSQIRNCNALIAEYCLATLSHNQHRVAVGIETVAQSDSFTIRRQNSLSAREGGDQRSEEHTSEL